MKKFFCVIGIILIIGTISLLIVLKLDNKKYDTYKITYNKKVIEVIKNIKKYNKYVKTTKESILYDLDHKQIGKINKDIELELDNYNIHNGKLYFKIKKLNYYILFDNNIDKINNVTTNDRYKRYIPFNQNVITKGKTTLYNDKGYVYQINQGINTPLIIKDKNKYYVSYNNNLYYVKKSESSLKDKKNTNEKTRTNIRTFTYHAVFKPGEECQNKAICHPYKQFNSHMKYLADNNYLTLTMEELEMFLDKKINIPIKTVVITLDDGNLAKNAIEVLDKYKLYATYFIITGKYNSYKLKSNYVKFESHTDKLHNNYKCPGGEQGGQLLCEKEEVVLKDLKTSQQKLGGSHYLSYPFFDWNERAIKLLKQSGFRLAFIGQWTTEGYSDYSTNRMMMRRKTIFSTDSLDTFVSYLK